MKEPLITRMSAAWSQPAPGSGKDQASTNGVVELEAAAMACGSSKPITSGAANDPVHKGC